MVAPSPQLPSRLLDLGSNKPRLECDVESIDNLRYTTLSHIWGKDPASYLQLKEETIEQFKIEVPSNAMPIKYNDAIRITRVLGIRYLWIDSLCIMQDSQSDWQTEAVKMAAIYGASACNISSATYSSWSTEGYRKVCSLLSRAWVFQERLLCPRTIYYGHDRLLWECCETFDDEFSGPMPQVPRSKAQLYSVFSGMTQDELFGGSIAEFNLQWSQMINEYRSCKLTFHSDRAIAFSGIASAIQSHTSMTYLAGIWKESAHLGLLWCVKPAGPKGRLRLPILEMQDGVKAPSWSWFSVPCQLSPEYDLVDHSLSLSASLRPEGIVFHASVLTFEHPKLSAEPGALCYDFAGLRIKLSTYKIPAGLRWENNLIQLLPHGRPMLPENPRLDYDPRTAMMCNLDDLSLNINEKLPENSSMILLVFTGTHLDRRGGKRYPLNYTDQVSLNNNEASFWWTTYLFSGLVVVPEINPYSNNYWKRIGIYSFSVTGPTTSTKVVLPFDFESREPDEIWLI
ncbi:Heterokaryon incompatibility protein [Rutstroemia sp. NJR-2017a BBW]|nr:Heterokaryon incompatibility protein [Rutstroemia sp. NJR-2017a BBW]